MKFYRSTITGKIVSEKAIRDLHDIYGNGPGNCVDEHILKENILIEISEPSIVDCLDCGNDGIAILRYRELHPDVSFEVAKNEVKKIRKKHNIPYAKTSKKGGSKNARK